MSPRRDWLARRAGWAALACVLAGTVACGPGAAGDAGADGAPTSDAPAMDAARDTASGDGRTADGPAFDSPPPDAPVIDSPPPDSPPPPPPDGPAVDGTTSDGDTGDGDMGDAELCHVSATVTLCNTFAACDPRSYMASCIDPSRLRTCEPMSGDPTHGTVWYYYCPALGGMCRACRADAGECAPGSQSLCAP